MPSGIGGGKSALRALVSVTYHLLGSEKLETSVQAARERTRDVGVERCVRTRIEAPTASHPSAASAGQASYTASTNENGEADTPRLVFPASSFLGDACVVSTPLQLSVAGPAERCKHTRHVQNTMFSRKERSKERSGILLVFSFHEREKTT